MRNSAIIRGVVWGMVWGLAWLPAVWLIYLVRRYAVDLPLYDAWDLPGVMMRSSMTLATVLRQHNESRPAFPQLISYALAKLTHWDTRWEMGLTLIEAVANLWMMLRLYVIGERKLTEAGAPAVAWGVRPAMVFLAGLFVFNMFQLDFLWGLQYLCHIPTTCLLISMLFFESRRAIWAKHVLGVMLCVFAMFSFSNGMILWGLVGGYYLLRGGLNGRNRAWLGLWVPMAAASFWVYFNGYVHPEGLPKWSAAFHHPGELMMQFFEFFGAPLGYLERNELSLCISLIAGFLIVATAAGGFFAALWQRRNGLFFAANLPWMVISTYLIASGFMAAVGRSGFGRYAMFSTTRYGEFSNYLPAVLIFWEAGVHRYFEWKGAAWRVVLPRVRYLQVGMVAVLLPLSAAFSFPRMVEWHRIRLQYRAAMMFVEDVPSPRLWIVYPEVNRLVVYMKKMRAMDVIRPIPDPGMFEAAARRPVAGEINEALWHDGKLRLYGWAVLPGKMRVADIVVVTAVVEGKTKAMEVAYAELPAPPSAKHALLPQNSGWAVNAAELPEGAASGTIRAWAVDGETGALYPLSGTVPAQEAVVP